MDQAKNFQSAEHVKDLDFNNSTNKKDKLEVTESKNQIQIKCCW